MTSTAGGDPGAFEFGAGDAVLHVTPPGGKRGGICSRLVAAGTDAEFVDLLRIEYEPDTPTATGNAERGPSPSALVVVGSDGEQVCDGGPRVTRIASRDHLVGVGLAVGEQLGELAGGEKDLVVCFDGLEAVFEHVPFEEAFEFLHVLVRTVSSAGAASHFHLDPSDGPPVARIAVLFDRVLHEREDGTVEVREY